MKLMQVWLVCIVVFFVAAELYQWLQGVTLPMPLFAIAGALLAVASNTQVWLPKQVPRQPGSSPQPAPATVEPAAPESTPIEPAIPPAPTARYYPGVQLPNLDPQPPRSISFTVQNPKS